MSTIKISIGILILFLTTPFTGLCETFSDSTNVANSDLRAFGEEILKGRECCSMDSVNKSRIKEKDVQINALKSENQDLEKINEIQLKENQEQYEVLKQSDKVIKKQTKTINIGKKIIYGLGALLIASFLIK